VTGVKVSHKKVILQQKSSKVLADFLFI